MCPLRFSLLLLSFALSLPQYVNFNPRCNVSQRFKWAAVAWFSLLWQRVSAAALSWFWREDSGVSVRQLQVSVGGGLLPAQQPSTDRASLA
jgi:hypothetical protein